ncbi:MAG: hypothetical protein EAS51_08750 [Microbacteriaceae bacterium]|nr:MAG: hypothetical protein EAS51_08750 [Microbacteriaceae bacterium]
MRSAPRSFAVLPLALVAVLAAPAAASASEGSVPPEVTAYVTGGGLVERLDAVYGLNADGEGIDFDDATTPGPVSRVYHWTDDRLAGDVEANATRMVNEWVVPVTVAEEPVGVAIVWINLDTERPELAEFQADPAAAVALAEVPEAARLVRDRATGAWLALEDGVLTPLVAGASGLAGPVPLEDYEVVAPQPEPEPEVTDAGLGIAIAASVALFLVIVLALYVLPRVRRGGAPDEAGAEGPEQPEAADAAAEEAEADEPSAV